MEEGITGTAAAVWPMRKLWLAATLWLQDNSATQGSPALPQSDPSCVPRYVACSCGCAIPLCQSFGHNKPLSHDDPRIISCAGGVNEAVAPAERTAQWTAQTFVNLHATSKTHIIEMDRVTC